MARSLARGLSVTRSMAVLHIVDNTSVHGRGCSLILYKRISRQRCIMLPSLSIAPTSVAGLPPCFRHHGDCHILYEPCLIHPDHQSSIPSPLTPIVRAIDQPLTSSHKPTPLLQRRIRGDMDDVGSSTAGFVGAHAIFATTDYWILFLTLPKPMIEHQP